MLGSSWREISLSLHLRIKIVLFVVESLYADEFALVGALASMLASFNLVAAWAIDAKAGLQDITWPFITVSTVNQRINVSNRIIVIL